VVAYLNARAGPHPDDDAAFPDGEIGAFRVKPIAAVGDLPIAQTTAFRSHATVNFRTCPRSIELQVRFATLDTD
jgi:hypothetical protein